MSQLPGAANATVPVNKVTRYQLDPNHSASAAGKAKFFGRYGFTQAKWPELQKALKIHPSTTR